MTKKRIFLLVAVVCVASLFIGAAGAGLVSKIQAELRRDFSIVIDGEERIFKNVNGETVYPVLYEGTTYLPVRAIGEIMGKKVYWYENEKRIELKEEKSTVTDADVIVHDPIDNNEKGKKTDSVAEVSKKEKKNVDKSSFIGEDKAKEIAIEKSGLAPSAVKFEKVELDKDNGIWQYEIEFKKGNVEYEADINAEDGTILKWEVDSDD